MKTLEIEMPARRPALSSAERHKRDLARVYKLLRREQILSGLTDDEDSELKLLAIGLWIDSGMEMLSELRAVPGRIKRLERDTAPAAELWRQIFTLNDAIEQIDREIAAAQVENFQKRHKGKESPEAQEQCELIAKRRSREVQKISEQRRELLAQLKPLRESIEELDRLKLQYAELLNEPVAA